MKDNVKRLYKNTNEFFKEKLVKIKNIQFENYIFDYKKLIKPAVILLIIYLLATYPIIRANFNYIDDFGRVLSGYRGWDDFSRYTNQFLSIIIHTSTYMADISPLPQLIAVIFLVLASIIVLYTFKNGEKYSVFYILAALPIGLCPYFLECLSYKFDAPYMALSIFVSTLPLLFSKMDNKKDIFKYCVMSIIGTIIMCTTYQASSGMYPVLVLFLSFKMWKEKDDKSAIKLIITSGISYIIGLLIFKFFIVTTVSSYVSSTFLDMREVLKGSINNIITYYEYVQNDFRSIWILLIQLIGISFILVNTLESKRNKIISFFISTAVFILALTLAFGLYPALDKPLFAPRAMYGIGMVIALLCLNSTNTTKKYSIIPKFLVLMLSGMFFVFAFVYGNGLSEQKRFTEYRIEQVVDSLNELEVLKDNNEPKTKLNVVGDIGKSPVLSNTINVYPLLERLIPNTFGEKWVWAYFQFYNYFGLNKNYLDAAQEDWSNLRLPVIEETMNYTIRGNKNNILVILK